MGRLTDARLRALGAVQRITRLWDGEGLYLEVRPGAGAGTWYFKYRVKQPDGGLKEKRLTLGRRATGPGQPGRLMLAQARAKAREAKVQIQAGADPAHQRVVARIESAQSRAHTFEVLARQWHEQAAVDLAWTPNHTGQVLRSLERHVFPELGALPLREITAGHIAKVLRDMRDAPDMLGKVRQRIRAVFDFAVAEGLLTANPTPPAIRTRREERHFPFLRDLDALGGLLRQADNVMGSPGVRRAHLLLAFTAQRVGEVVPAQWSEIDFDGAVWRIPRERMKRRKTAGDFHLVPLPRGLLALLRDWHATRDPANPYVCVSPLRERTHLTRETIEKWYRETLLLRGEHSPHSWRSAFSSLAHDAGMPHDAIEAQLDHLLHDSAVAGAYDRGTRLEARRKLVQWWESTLLAAKRGTQAAAA